MTSKRFKKRLLGLLVSLVIMALINYTRPAISPPKTWPAPGTYRVVSWADGDTFSVDMQGRTEKVRLIGVDTPETHDPRKTVQCFGQAAADFTKKLVGNNNVRLEADSLSTNRDRYNRLLRYAYLPDGRLINREIIAEGYGFAYTSFPFTKSDDFRTAQTNARITERGLWQQCQPQPNQYGGYTSQ